MKASHSVDGLLSVRQCCSLDII